MKENRVQVDVVESGEPLREFWNKGGFVLCTAGYADVRINEQRYRLTRGCVFVVTPLVQVYDFRPSPDFAKISFVRELKDFYPIFRLISDTGIPLKVKEKPCWQIPEAEIGYVISQYDRIAERMREAEAAGTSDERSMLTHLVHLIGHETMLEIVCNHIRRYPASVDSVRNHSGVAYRFILALHENYRVERTVSRYAALANMSTGHFSAVIREATGRSPSEWIASVTTTYAKLLLEQTDKSIKEIAEELNFPEQFTFRKYFKRHAGVSPTEYRSASR